MSDDHLLLAHLVPKLTRVVEDAATDALAFILNESEACLDALIEFVNDSTHALAPVQNAATQVAPSETARLDLVAYDSDGRMRLIIESKFWAPLLDGQASGYVKYLSSEGPTMLLFVAPEPRHPLLWGKIRAQFENGSEAKLGPDGKVGKIKVADVIDTQKRVALVSWSALLDHLKEADPSRAHDVQQLQGLTQAQGAAAFTPLHAEDFNQALPRRMLDYNRIVDDVVWAHGVCDGWMSVKGMKATPQYDGYLRFFQFRSEDGNRLSQAFALYASYDQWARSGITPMWLRLWHSRQEEIDTLRGQSDVEYEWTAGGHLWIPLRLLTGVEYADVLEDVVAQVERVRDIVLPAPEETEISELTADDAESAEDAGVGDLAAEQ
ncbi:hypothetical protein [Candidatus Poriferisodalis sp.]|uniref:hypothetical protein n=1 Tax=Candidatus Poriferisodalis sp. TaxID=3101277 RepID=UPI003C6F4699